jgi:Ala-tRNA(Pro) deacylase
VTPFAALHDEAHNVTSVLDQEIAGGERVHCHPLTNDRTTAIAGADLVRFLSSVGHAPQILDLTRDS